MQQTFIVAECTSNRHIEYSVSIFATSVQLSSFHTRRPVMDLNKSFLLDAALHHIKRLENEAFRSWRRPRAVKMSASACVGGRRKCLDLPLGPDFSRLFLKSKSLRPRKSMSHWYRSANPLTVSPSTCIIDTWCKGGSKNHSYHHLKEFPLAELEELSW